MVVVEIVERERNLRRLQEFISFCDLSGVGYSILRESEKEDEYMLIFGRFKFIKVSEKCIDLFSNRISYRDVSFVELDNFINRLIEEV